MSINYRKSHSIRIAFKIFFPEIKLNCFIARSVFALVFVLFWREWSSSALNVWRYFLYLLQPSHPTEMRQDTNTEMKSWLLGPCKLMGQCRHMPGDCSLCWSTSWASALVIHFWLPSPPSHAPQVLSSYLPPIQKVSHIFFIHPHKTRHFPLFNPSFISHFLHASACHILFLLHSVHPPHTTRATINPPLPPAFMPLWYPGVPPTFSPPLCISAPCCGSPHPPSMAKVLLWPLTHSHCWCQRQTHKHWTKNKPTCSPSLLCFPPTSWFFLQTQRVFTTNMLQLLPHFTAQFCSAPTLLHSTDFYPAKARAEQSKPCKLCQLLLLPLLLPWHASACSSQGGSLELATGLFGGLPASWMCQPLRQLHPTPTDMLCSSNWPPWRVFCLCLQSTDVQKANHANLR